MKNTLRYNIIPNDLSQIREVLESSGFFYDFEVETALELIKFALDTPSQTDYFNIVSETDGKVSGWVCYGKTPCTVDSYDLYWIAVHQITRGNGLGKILMKTAEEKISVLGGKKIWVETSGREFYAPTRKFYESIGYVKQSELADFYADGDSKVTYLKKV